MPDSPVMFNDGAMPIQRSTAATGTNPTEASAKTFTFDPRACYVHIESLSVCPADLYVRWNGNDTYPASATDWDTVVRPADGGVTSPKGLYVETVSIYFTAACALGTHFSCRGME